MYGRQYELDTMNYLYNKGGFQLVILYGRRRIGKTTLITEFIKNKNSIFFSAEQDTKDNNLNKFSNIVFKYFNEDKFESFKSIDNLLLYIVDKVKNEKLIIVIDEFPYFCKYYASLLSNLQHIIDHKLINTNIYLILSGSYMSFMEKNVLGEKSPLFGRRTAQIKLEGFDYLDALNFNHDKDNKKCCEIYGALGGTPLYLSLYDKNVSFKENIINLYLNRMGYLYEETKLLLKQEIEEPYVYNAIIEAIALGYTKSNEISTKIGEENAKCIKYLTTLISLGIIYKETAFGTKENSRKTIYQISDFMFRFWYKYVFNNHSLIENNGGNIVYSKIINKTYNDYMGHIFEKICIQYMNRINALNKLPFVFTKIGRWWGNDKKKHQEIEIDIVASDNDNYIFGECKWTNELCDKPIFDKLEYNSNIFDSGKKNKYYVIFSKSGFTDELLKIRKNNKNILLLDINDIYKLR